MGILRKIEKTTSNSKATSNRKVNRSLLLETFEPRQLMAAEVFGSDIVIQADSKGADVSVDNVSWVDSRGMLQSRIRVTENGKFTDFKNEALAIKGVKFIGSEQSDTFVNRTGLRTVAFGYGGNDLLQGGRAGDTIFGGTGRDWIFGGRGNDYLNGEEEDDYVNGGEDNDTIQGGSGNDNLGAIVLGGYRYSEPGNDTILGESGVDTINGDSGNDLLNGGSEGDTIFGGVDNDVLGEQSINGVWYAETGDDTFYGEDGNDTIRGGIGVDRIFGGAHNDILYGGPGNDVLYGEDGEDRLYGEGGGDVLLGGRHNDALFGGDSNAVDSLIGGEGADRFLVDDSDGAIDWTTNDALIRFDSSEFQWSESEVQQVDKGLAFMHQLTGNTRLLKLANGASMTFRRVAVVDPVKPNVLADNNSRGLVRFGSNTFTSSTPASETTIHELAHNFDKENMWYGAWLGLSGWVPRTQMDILLRINRGTVSLDGKWFYDPKAVFARGNAVDSYGRTNPREDWATCWELYSRVRGGEPVSSADQALYNQLGNKMALIDLFVTNMRV